MWCDINGNNCYIEPPLLPSKPGVYVWCVKSLDTATGLNSEPCVMDTVTILPVVKVKNLTIMNSVNSNPKNSKIQSRLIATSLYSPKHKNFYAKYISLL